MAGPAVCSFYAAGACRNGASCRFSHDVTAASRAPADATRKARVPCKFFLANACTAGRDCKFSHDLDQRTDAIVTTSAGERKPVPGAFGTRCKFYDKGTCTTGSACPYRHVDGSWQNNSEHGSSHSGARARAPVGSSVKMHVLQPKTRKQSNATAEGVQTEGEATTQREEEDKQSGGVAQLSDFLSKEEELYYYGAPGDFDMMQQPNDTQYLEGKPSYAEVAALNAHEDEDADHAYYAEPPPAPPKMCTFYLQGACRYGDACFYSHSLEKAPSALTAAEREIVQQELKASADLECGICYDLIMAKGERFGLLSGCSHAFCLPCVRNWRGNADQPKQTVRQCPVCRVDTHFVIPSNRMITDPERKKQLIREYTKNLASIPCRHFDEGRGECPFGTSCFYAHRYPTGEEEVRQVRTAVDAEGQYDVLRNMRLNHFFENLDLQ